MTSQSQQNRVEMTPLSINGATTMILQTESPIPPDSISETALCARWDKCPRTLLIWRKAGRMPPYFLATTPKRTKPQIFYWLADIAAHEQRVQQKTEPQK